MSSHSLFAFNKANKADEGAVNTTPHISSMLLISRCGEKKKSLQLHSEQNSWPAFVDESRKLKLLSALLSLSFFPSPLFVPVSHCYKQLLTRFSQPHPSGLQP